jgi:hypothetical protein
MCYRIFVKKRNKKRRIKKRNKKRVKIKILYYFIIKSNKMSSNYIINSPLVLKSTLTTSQPIVSNNITSTNATINNATINNVLSFSDLGSIYFQTGSSTGCFIDSLNYNSTGAEHYVYFNNSTKELSQASPDYFFSYATGAQDFTASNTFESVIFNVDPIIYNTFQHTLNGSVFTGTFDSPVTLELSYNLEIYSATAAPNNVAATLYLDGNPIKGSYRNVTISVVGQIILSHTILVNISNGSHSIELKAASTDKNNIKIGNNIPTPTPPSADTYSSVSLVCRRII